MSELLIELYSEEVPALAQANCANILYSSISTKLKEYTNTKISGAVYYTPTRITIVLNQLPDNVSTKDEMLKGPKISAMTEHIEAFMKKNSIHHISDLEIVDGFYYVKKDSCTKPNSIKDLLAKIITKSMEELVWPKSMTWAGYSLKWIRPLKNILCIFDGEVVEMQFHHLSSNNLTFGHKFLSGKQIPVLSFDDYASKLRLEFVEFDNNKREAKIKNELNQLSIDHSIELIEDNGLLSEVVGITEYPSVVIGEINDRYMKLPEEILISSLRTHQKIFMFREKGGSLAPFFAHVINTKYNENIMQNTQKVIVARLNDAEFFFNQDIKNGLEANKSELERMVFHEKIGSVYQKSQSMGTLAVELAKYLDIDITKVKRAAELAKLDLATNIVAEFPELQGIIGYRYAIYQGEDMDVALAIKEHYMPRGRGDELPTSNIGAVLAIAEKLDTLNQMFRVGIRPTGSKDQYALRRAAIGFIRIQEKFSFKIDLALIGITSDVIDFIESKRVHI